MSEVIRVGMGDYKICRAPQKISTLGLGSCLGVVLYDKSTRICGLAHVMLPDSRRVKKDISRLKFVDTCLQDMYDDLLRQSVNPVALVAKIVGGAKMFSYQSDTSFMNIGAQNIRAVREKLHMWDIPVVAQDVGKTCGRTIVFDPETGELHISTIGVGTSII